MIIDFEQLGISHDWNENDPTKPGYIKNRPFYTGDPVETVFVEESSVSFTEGRRGWYRADFESTFVPTLGKVYKVSWDGAVYECTGVDFSDRVAIGNLSIIGAGSDTGEPFVMDVLNGVIIIITRDTSDTHTFSISGTIEQVVKINTKYLPELPYMNKVNPTGSGSFSLNRKANTTIGECSFAEGYNTTASNFYSHAEGYNTTASGEVSHAEGLATIASSNYQHVQGKYNIEDSSGIYADIVGNGSSNGHSNAYTLDWKGNAWYSGTIEGKALILPSSTADSTKKFKITVDDSGAITATEVV